ncbi:MAG: DNA recombination protein RmuC [Alphaproteobacteria bacterium]|nr:DNA recombination protein RmuC [Alphaproteobacteria bacterium]
MSGSGFAIAIAAVVLLVAVAGGFALVLAQLRRPRQDPMAQWQAEQIASLTSRLQALAESQVSLQNAIGQRLDGVTQRLGDGLSQSAEKTAKSLGEIQQRLNVIDKAQENITKLSSDVVGLQDILSNKQARGAFGEIQLNDLVSATLPPSAYEFQATLSNGKRADCLILLPKPPGAIAVDAKFPLESYRALLAAERGEDRKLAERAFRTDVLKHVADIAERYIVAGDTADSALMFLPSEAVYAELHANFREVVERSFQAKVWIVSPTTMMATLNTVRAILRDVRMREQAGLIQKEVAVLMKDVRRLDARVDNLQKHFHQATRDVDEIVISSKKIAGRADKIEELELEEEQRLRLVPEPGKAAEG